MGSITLELWEVLDIEHDDGDGHKIGLGAYPIPAYWQPADRDALNKLIIDHYWNREIGFETVSIFQHRLGRKMNEIMRLYNQLYESTRIQFDPLSTYDLRTVRAEDTTETGTRDTTSTATNTTNSKSRGVSSSPPQTQLSANGQYATSVTDSTTEGSGTSGGTSADTSNGTVNAAGNSATTGYQGSAARLLTEYRSTLLNIDMMVIGDLEELFLGVWDSGEEMLPQKGIFL